MPFAGAFVRAKKRLPGRVVSFCLEFDAVAAGDIAAEGSYVFGGDNTVTVDIHAIRFFDAIATGDGTAEGGDVFGGDGAVTVDITGLGKAGNGLGFGGTATRGSTGVGFYTGGICGGSGGDHAGIPIMVLGPHGIN